MIQPSRLADGEFFNSLLNFIPELLSVAREAPTASCGAGEFGAVRQSSARAGTPTPTPNRRSVTTSTVDPIGLGICPDMIPSTDYRRAKISLHNSIAMRRNCGRRGTLPTPPSKLAILRPTSEVTEFDLPRTRSCWEPERHRRAVATAYPVLSIGCHTRRTRRSHRLQRVSSQCGLNIARVVTDASRSMISMRPGRHLRVASRAEHERCLFL
jgi:hypothetical protein